jgi:hypothetical protein
MAPLVPKVLLAQSALRGPPAPPVTMAQSAPKVPPVTMAPLVPKVLLAQSAPKVLQVTMVQSALRGQQVLRVRFPMALNLAKCTIGTGMLGYFCHLGLREKHFFIVMGFQPGVVASQMFPRLPYSVLVARVPPRVVMLPLMEELRSRHVV